MKRTLTKALCVLLLVSLAIIQTFAQSTPAGTVITNAASATYSDAAGNNYSAVSNTVSVTVAAIGGLTITPDAQVSPNVAPNETRLLPFTLTNTGNFAQGIVFPASGAGIVVTGPVTVTRAVIDLNGNGTIDASDTDIKGNGAAVTSASIASNGTLPVLVEVQANASATAGAAVTINLGDTATNAPSYDNQPSNSSANDVHTADATAVNGLIEAKGSYTTTIENDALIQVTLTAPSGPLAPGNNIDYTTNACNNGQRAATAITLSGNSSVYIIAPIPLNTSLASGQTFPAGTLYSTSPLTTAPTAATYVTTIPTPLSTIKRIAFPHGASLAVGACTATFPYSVTINPGVNPITVPTIDEIVDVFATNSLGNTITDQSGDPTPNAGDGNANFDEGNNPGSTDGNGVIQKTTLAGQPLVHLGPQSNPDSTTMNNITTDCKHYDFTTWPQVDFSTLTGNLVITSPKAIKNAGTLPFSFGLIQGHKSADEADTPNKIFWTSIAGPTFTDSAPDITTEVSFDNGATWKQLQSANGLSSLTTPLTSSIHTVDAANVPMAGLTVLPGQTVNFLARHTIPQTRYTGRKNVTVTMYAGLYFAGTQNPMSASYSTVTSSRSWVGGGAWAGTCPGSQIFDATADTALSASADVVKSYVISNTTGVGATTDPAPGAEIHYTLTITGKLPGSTPDPSLTNGPWDVINRFPLASSQFTLTENGSTAPNNWATYTDQVVGSAQCSVPATITGDTAGSSSLTFTLTNPITAGQIVTCEFRRKIK